MAVGANPELDHVEDRWRSGVFAEQPSVVLGAGSKIAPLHRHRMKLRGAQHRWCDEQIGDLARVASFIVLRHDSLIHLEHLEVVPMDAQAAQVAEHPPRGAPAAQGNEAATALRTRTPNLGAQPVGCTLGCDFRGWKHMDAHAVESSENGGYWSGNLIALCRRAGAFAQPNPLPRDWRYGVSG